MPEEDSVIALIVVGEGSILSATRNGYGKRTPPEDYPTKGRGGMGVIDIKTTTRNGPVIGAVQVGGDDEIMLITDAGTLVRTAVDGVSTVGRNTQGVRLIRLNDDESLVELAKVDESEINADADAEADSDSDAVADADADADAVAVASADAVVDADGVSEGETGDDSEGDQDAPADDEPSDSAEDNDSDDSSPDDGER